MPGPIRQFSGLEVGDRVLVRFDVHSNIQGYRGYRLCVIVGLKWNLRRLNKKELFEIDTLECCTTLANGQPLYDTRVVVYLDGEFGVFAAWRDGRRIK